MISDKEIDDYVRSQPENVTQYDVEIPTGLNSATRKLYIRKIKELEEEYNKIPYMMAYLSDEQEKENSKKRIELFLRIQTYKSILNEE